VSIVKPIRDAGRVHVLVIAYAYPPCGGAGVQRTAKTVKYLARADWDVSVLTVDPSAHGVHDPSHDSDVDVHVVRTRFFDPIAQVTRGSDTEGVASATQSPSKQRGPLRALAKRAWNVVDDYLLIPDRFILWYPAAVRAAMRMCKDKPFDVIYATGDPYSTYLIAMRIAHRLGVSFVIDMRDPWTLVPYRSETRPPTRSAIERWLEARVLRSCAACIFANRSIDTYAAAYPDLRDKFAYVPNGYDPTDFEGVEPRRFDRFTFVHNGSFLSGYRTADTLFHGVAALLRDDPARRSRLKIVMVGKIGDERALSAQLGLEDVVSHVGYLPHRESLSYVAGADALLLVGGARLWEETGKVFEYLAAARPILAVVEPDGAAAELLRRSGTARIVTRDSVPETVAALRDLMDSARVVQQPGWLTEYSRESLSKRIASVLASAARGSEGVAVQARPAGL